MADVNRVKIFVGNGVSCWYDKKRLFNEFSAIVNMYETINHVDIGSIVAKVLPQLKDNMNLTEIYILMAESAAEMIRYHSNYSLLAGRFYIHRLYQVVPKKISEASRNIAILGKLKSEYIDTVDKYKIFFDKFINAKYDYINIDYFAIKTLEKSFLIRRSRDNEVDTDLDLIMETPQQLYLRVAIALHGSDITKVEETFEYLQKGFYTHATPTMATAGMKIETLASCYIIDIDDDSVEEILKAITKITLCVKNGGGVGLSVSNIRGKGSRLGLGCGNASGIVSLLRFVKSATEYIDQGRRPGAIAVYIEIWHPDIFILLYSISKTCHEQLALRNLFVGLWCCDLFMRRVEKDEMWSLMCPSICKNLTTSHSEEFEKLYMDYEKNGNYVRQVSARTLWMEILQSQLENGIPYLLYKDTINQRSNQAHLGTIKSSNLCAEITLFTGKQKPCSEVSDLAVCNLASIALPKMTLDATKSAACTVCKLSPRILNLNNRVLVINRYDIDCTKCTGGFDFKTLYDLSRVTTRNLNITIDNMHYNVDAARITNLAYRPIAIGVQGFADVLGKLRLTWDSIEAQKLNSRIFEIIYRGSVHESNLLAQKYGPFKTFEESSLALGTLAPQQWFQWYSKKQKATSTLTTTPYFEANWLPSIDELTTRVREYGLRNSQLTAVMPTATTAQILGNTEGIEARTSNLYLRRVHSGQFYSINTMLVSDMMKLGIWEDISDGLLANRGSVQNIEKIPPYLKEVYKTVWEIETKTLYNLNFARQPWVDQSISFNIYMDKPDILKLTEMHFYGWKKGFKTGSYYLHSKPAGYASQFTIDPSELTEKTPEKNRGECSFQCDNCSA